MVYSFLLWLVAAATTVYFAFMYDSPAILLIAFLEVVYLDFSVVAVLFRKFTVRGELSVPIEISEVGKENLVKVIVTNKSRLALRRAKVRLAVKDTISGHVERSWMKLPILFHGEQNFVRNVAFPGAGNYEITLEKIRVYDPTGLMFGTVRVRSTASVLVMPVLHDVSVHLTGAVKMFYGESDVYDQHSPGYDRTELFRVREYQKGDRLQNVHWKLTAKQDELMVKDGSLPLSCPIVLVLKAFPRKKREQKAHVVSYLEAAASLSYSLVEAKCPHFVVWYDESEKDIVRLRVDDDESLFYFIGVLMRIKWARPAEDVSDWYREKYRMEHYVWMLSLEDDLTLKKGDDVLAKLAQTDINEALSQLELLL